LPNSTKNEFVRSFFGRIRGYQKVLSKLSDLYLVSSSAQLLCTVDFLMSRITTKKEVFRTFDTSFHIYLSLDARII
jgi:hypothetical protein